MQTQASLNQYFTEQIVGAPVCVSLGRSDRVRRTPSHGVVIDRLNADASLLRQATLSLLSDAPAPAGRPLNLASLARTRTRLLLIGLAGWTAGIVAVMHWWPLIR
jgi:hypothetical protein